MEKQTLCIVGLGYVGLPLAHAFAKAGFPVIGFDVNETRIAELQRHHDRTRELSEEELRNAPIDYTTDASAIARASIVILAIPTPVDAENKPDLSLVEAATRAVGAHLRRGMIVVYESTVYPGVTEEICGPILEQTSGLVCGKDFTLGYSPERINPGDKNHTVETIVKIVAGQDHATLDTLSALYGSIVKAGIHRAPSIKVAEMAKAIENAQRDINIAYVNEIAMLCTHLGIRTKDVLDAAGTKWNFLRFQPGLVGGHCIGVDPYYLIEKAKDFGMDTRLITAGRAINDGLASFIVSQVRAVLGEGSKRILILGLTFKEDVPDTRNSKVMDVIATLRTAGHHVEAHDPFVKAEAIQKMGLQAGSLDAGPYDAILLLVPHKEYRSTPLQSVTAALPENGLLYDLKSMVDGAEVIAQKRRYLSL